MSYSATKASIDTYNAMFSGNESSNTWISSKGNKCFADIGRENSDGAMTGEIWKFTIGTHAIKYSSFRIEPTGEIKRFPLATKEMKKRAKDAFALNNHPFVIF